ncbi:MAG: hypothetical protein AAGA97_02795 [Pseudomonadota bacterium]
MSDPVSSREVEDVLSSIKRLVSIHSREPKRENDEASSALPGEDFSAEEILSEEASGFDKLVLNQAYLVDDEDVKQSQNARPEENNPPSDRQTGSAQEQNSRHADHHDEVLGVEENSADSNPGVPPECERAPSTETQLEDHNPPASDLSDTDEDAEITKTTFDESEVVFRHLGSQDVPFSQDSDPIYASDIEGELAQNASLEARIAEVEAAIAAREDQWDPDISEQDDYAGKADQAVPWDEASQDGAHENKVTTQPESEPSVEDRAPDTQTNDASDSESATAEPLMQADITAASAEKETQWYSEDLAIDEEALRELVSDIVRRELQGALGERITRNVRKLVRREIHRAMVGRDFE